MTILGHYMVLFHQSTMHFIYYVHLVGCFNICHVVGVQSCTLHFYLIKNCFHWHPRCIKTNYKLSFWGTLDGCIGRSLVNFFLSRIASQRGYLNVRQDVTFIEERVCACGYWKRERLSAVLAVFLKSAVLQTKVTFNKVKQLHCNFNSLVRSVWLT